MPKKQVNMRLDEALVEAAKQTGPNLTAFVERAMIELLEKRHPPAQIETHNPAGSPKITTSPDEAETDAFAERVKELSRTLPKSVARRVARSEQRGS